ncbi:MAG TPA: YbhB/YbcL family Raf kinase inhibitor-like protein [Bacteroidales bacterium]|nr:YbhB/YbcL family Raf kinase inhibitor-like protein [Bacteroidales bacterium]
MLFFLAGCLTAAPQDPRPKKMNIESRSFSPDGSIPPQFTCDGKNISPALLWKGFPAGTQSFALIVDDPDARAGTWIHWLLFNIPSSVTSLEENFSYDGRKETRILAGVNDFGSLRYGGPCPPSGTHRYLFKIYALDIFLELKEGASRKQVEAAMAGHVLANGELIGLYRRK